jgi:hypothetical protein
MAQDGSLANFQTVQKGFGIVGQLLKTILKMLRLGRLSEATWSGTMTLKPFFTNASMVVAQ